MRCPIHLGFFAETCPECYLPPRRSGVAAPIDRPTLSAVADMLHARADAATDAHVRAALLEAEQAVRRMG